MDFEEWKKKAASEAKRLAGIADLLEEDDPYSIEDDMSDAFEEDVDPEDFIRDAFADEIEDYGGDEEEAPAAEDDGDLEDDDEENDDLDDEGDDEFDEDETP